MQTKQFCNMMTLNISLCAYAMIVEYNYAFMQWVLKYTTLYFKADEMYLSLTEWPLKSVKYSTTLLTNACLNSTFAQFPNMPDITSTLEQMA